MKTIIILIEPGQLGKLIEDLRAAQTTPETSTIALILSERAIHVQNTAFTFPEEADFYVGPITTLGFRGSLQEIRRQLQGREVN